LVAPWYTIVNINISTGGFAFELMDCDDDDLEDRREFHVEEVTHLDLSAWGAWLVESGEADQAIAGLLVTIEKLLEIRAAVPIIIKMAKKLTKKIDGL